MKIPNLNRRISIQTQSAAQDSTGQPVQTWTTQYTCWANVSIQNSALIYSTAEFMSKVVHRITIRWTSSFVVQPNMRLTYQEATTGVLHVFNIEAVLNPEQGNVFVVLMCYELQAQE